MSGEDVDTSQLPYDELIGRKVWKDRLLGYQKIVAELETGGKVDLSLDTLKSMALDANVVAQEAAIQAASKYLGFCTLRFAASTIPVLVPALCEKGVSSTRPGTKTASTEVLLQLLEITGTSDPILEAIVPYFAAKQPKVVASCAAAARCIFENFGCAIASPKPVVPLLAKLFGHADRNVRAEASLLTVELYKWMGAALASVLMPELKPVQQKDLQKEFDKVLGTPEQKRLTRGQQEAARPEEDSSDMVVDDEPEKTFDPHAFLEAQDVLSHIPATLEERLEMPQWIERKTVLEETQQVLSKAPKMASGDYVRLVRSLAKALKDANIQVVQVSAHCIALLARGLRDEFRRYTNLVMAPLIERTKEKKPVVADALNGALDAIFEVTSLGEILNDAVNGLKHKTPQVKISAANLLQRSLQKTTVAPSGGEVKEMAEAGVKLLSESLEPVRLAGASMIGTLMKVTGEREMAPFLAKVDDNRKAKVMAVFKNTTVLLKGAGGRALAPQQKPVDSRETPQPRPASKPQAQPRQPAEAPASKPQQSEPYGVPSARAKPLPRTSIPSPFGGQSEFSTPKTVPVNRAKAVPSVPFEEPKIPSKRSATSPAKRDDAKPNGLKSSTFSLRESLMESNLRVAHAFERETSSNQNEATESAMAAANAEIERLRAENNKLLAKIQSTEELEKEHKQEALASLKALSEAHERILSLENQLSTLIREHKQEVESLRRAPRDLSSRVNLLTIGRDLSEEDSWKRASDVTEQLRARIEKMKERNRLSYGP